MSEPDDRELPEVTDARLEEALRTTRPYTIVVLRAGPRYSSPGAERSSEVDGIIWEHGKRNLALHSQGVMPLVFPVADGSDITGVCVFAADLEEVRAIMSRDPGVQAGIFTYEVHPTRSFPGSGLPR